MIGWPEHRTRRIDSSTGAPIALRTGRCLNTPTRQRIHEDDGWIEKSSSNNNNTGFDRHLPSSRSLRQSVCRSSLVNVDRHWKDDDTIAALSAVHDLPVRINNSNNVYGRKTQSNKRWLRHWTALPLILTSAAALSRQHYSHSHHNHHQAIKRKTKLETRRSTAKFQGIIVIDAIISSFRLECGYATIRGCLCTSVCVRVCVYRCICSAFTDCPIDKPPLWASAASVKATGPQLTPRFLYLALLISKTLPISPPHPLDRSSANYVIT